MEKTKKNVNYKGWTKGGIAGTILCIIGLVLLIALLVIVALGNDKNLAWSQYSTENQKRTILCALDCIGLGIFGTGLIISAIFWGLGRKHLKNNHAPKGVK